MCNVEINNNYISTCHATFSVLQPVLDFIKVERVLHISTRSLLYQE